MSAGNLFVFRRRTPTGPVFKAEPEMGLGDTTTDFRYAEVRGVTEGWPGWEGFEPIGILLATTQGGNRQGKKQRLEQIRVARKKPRGVR